MLSSKFPMFVAWGPDLAFLYNEAYAPILGSKHPEALGRPFREVWAEIWEDLTPLVEKALAGEASWLEDLPLTMNRHGYAELTWFTFSYSPARNDDGDVAGLFCACRETTDKVLALRKNVEERDRLAQLFSQAPAFMALLAEPEHRFELANQAYLQLVGHRDIVGRTVRDALPDVADQGFFELLDEVYRTGEPFVGRQLPILVQRQPGSSRERAFIDFVYQPVRDTSGSVRGIFVSGYDVTELRETQERLELAQRAGHIGAFEVRHASRKVAVSAEFCRIWGIPIQEEVPLDTTLAAIHPDDRHRVLTGEETIRPEAMGYLEYRIIRPDTGEVRWIARRAEAVMDETHQVLRYAGVIYDITDRRSVEDQLRLLNETLEERVEQRTADRDRMWRLSTDVMLVARFDGTIDAVNPAWTSGLGWTENELVGRLFLDLVHPDDLGATLAEVAKLEAGHTTLRFENRYRKKDGSYVWLSWTAVPDAGLIHAVGRNVDAEKAAQAELEVAQEALRQVQKMEAVGQLTGGIAHDFNNLLTIVTGNIDMAARALETAGVTDARTKRALDSAMKGAERAAALTQRLLAFSRRQPLAPKPTDVDKLVLGMSDLLHRALGETVRLEVVTSPGLWRVEVDPNQLENALLNLAVNARDAMPAGGNLVIETANARIDEEYAAAHAEVAPGHYVVISVTDTGQGMPKETVARVFEPFFTTKEVGKGTGLGLSMIYGFVKQSGGHVSVYSEVGQGTTVKIYLPRRLADGAPEEEAHLSAGLEVSRRRETVLVTEDDDDVRAYTVDCLRELGYRVLEAHDGASALRLLDRQEQPIDLLFTDVVMPGMSGRELADEARVRQPRLKVLYTSGYTRDAIQHGGRLDAGVEMIAKPFTYAALAQKIRDVLDAGRTGRILLVQSDPTVRLLTTDVLHGLGYTADESATAAEALAKLRASQGRYDIVLIDDELDDSPGDILLNELRALHIDMPVILAGAARLEALKGSFARDRCTRILAKPYSAAKLADALNDLGVSCPLQARHFE
ncbi:hybrid sensor histidine kinase/response regulator [Sphingomonas beigongshangi]|uniref:hybrid sensor histidine kinase/response regulator n=1 Tax=Sphingomonas beigongshangi TaxID=2782540 RepID=UPI001FEDC70C|nr:PAS domain S-box protein [Sphingomonas beigongshangi]